MKKELMDEIIELYNSFDKTDNYYEKSYIWYVLYDLKESLPHNQEITYMHNILNKKSNVLYDGVQKENYQVQKYIQDNMDFFNNNIFLPSDFSKCSNKVLKKYEKKELLRILSLFLNYLHPNIARFCLKMMDEDRILFGNGAHTIYTSLDNSNTIIFIKDLKTTYDLLALIHELSHAYYIYINNERINKRIDIEHRFKDEILPKIMEIKFINF